MVNQAKTNMMEDNSSPERRRRLRNQTAPSILVSPELYKTIKKNFLSLFFGLKKSNVCRFIAKAENHSLSLKESNPESGPNQGREEGKQERENSLTSYFARATETTSANCPLGLFAVNCYKIARGHEWQTAKHPQNTCRKREVSAFLLFQFRMRVFFFFLDDKTNPWVFSSKRKKTHSQKDHCSHKNSNTFLSPSPHPPNAF